MGVSFEDGIKYIECDGCQCEIRTNPIPKGALVFHPGCLPQ